MQVFCRVCSCIARRCLILETCGIIMCRLEHWRKEDFPAVIQLTTECNTTWEWALLFSDFASSSRPCNSTGILRDYKQSGSLAIDNGRPQGCRQPDRHQHWACCWLRVSASEAMSVAKYGASEHGCLGTCVKSVLGNVSMQYMLQLQSWHFPLHVCADSMHDVSYLKFRADKGYIYLSLSI